MKKSKTLAVCLLTAALAGCGTAGNNVEETATAENTQTTAENIQMTEENTQSTGEQDVWTVEEQTTDSKDAVSLTPFGSEPIELPDFSEDEIPDSEAIRFTSDMGIGWNLGNTFDAVDSGVSDEMDYESVWVGVKTEEAHIQTLYEAGFKTIRIPVSWHNHVDEDYNISTPWLDRVQEVVNWAYDRGLYVIINIHHDNSPDYEYPSYEKLDQSVAYTTKIWEQVSGRFADYDEHVIFETMNEPRQVGTDHEWWLSSTTSGDGAEACDCINQLNQAIVDTIRQNGSGHNPDRYIMVPGYCASPDFCTVNAFKIPEDTYATAENRILISAHAYTPYSFALDKSGTNEFSISGNNGTGDIDAVLKKLYDKYITRGIGVVIGEFGSMNKDNNTEARVEHAAYFVARASHYGIPCVWWDNNSFNGSGENFGLLRRVSNTFLYPDIVDQLIYYSMR